MNQNINDGVQAVRSAGQKVLDRVESAAGEVVHEAREAGEKLAHSSKRNRKHDRERARKRMAGLAASAASAVAFLTALLMRKRTKKS